MTDFIIHGELTLSEKHRHGRHEAAATYSVLVPHVDVDTFAGALTDALADRLRVRSVEMAPGHRQALKLYVSSSDPYNRDPANAHHRVVITGEDLSKHKGDGVTEGEALRVLSDLVGLNTYQADRMASDLNVIVREAHALATATATAHAKAQSIAKTAEHIGSWLCDEAQKRAAARVCFDERLAALVDEYQAATRSEALAGFSDLPRYYDEAETVEIEPEALALVSGFRSDFVERAVNGARPPGGFPRTHRATITSDDYDPEVAYLAAALLGAD